LVRKIIVISLFLPDYRTGIEKRKKALLSLKYLRLEKYFPDFNGKFCRCFDRSWHFEKLEMDAFSGSGDKQLLKREMDEFMMRYDVACLDSQRCPDLV
jgi:hypothetical protein